jgi:hypothetical protein
MPLSYTVDETDCLHRVLTTWERSADREPLPAPASDADFERLRLAGLALPAAFQSVYRRHNGVELFGGNLNLWPLTGESEITVEKLTNALRESGVPIPKELVLFGDNGQSEYFRFWVVGATQQKRWPVLSVGIADEPAIAVLATDFERFLRGWSAYYALVCEESQEVLDALSLPEELRSADPDDATFAAIWQWADPDYSQSFGRDPYIDPLSPALLTNWVTT